MCAKNAGTSRHASALSESCCFDLENVVRHLLGCDASLGWGEYKRSQECQGGRRSHDPVLIVSCGRFGNEHRSACKGERKAATTQELFTGIKKK